MKASITAAAIGFFATSLVMTGSAWAVIQSDKVHVADGKKTQVYIKDGLFVGGDRAIDDVIVKDIRRAANPGYDRIVIDLEGNRQGEPSAVERPPYYQVAVSPEEKRLVFTVWGSPKLQFDSKKVVAAFKKSTVIEKVELFPRLEDDSWTFSMNLRAGTPVEVFELSNPIRIIVDVKTPKAARAN